MSLGSDLSTIRKEKNLTLEDVYNICKIPIYTLEAIENDTFLTQPIDNKVYQRSFIRSFAKALKISDEHILIALDALEQGTYKDTLYNLVHGTNKPAEDDTIEFTIDKDKVSEVEPNEEPKTSSYKTDDSTAETSKNDEEQNSTEQTSNELNLGFDNTEESSEEPSDSTPPVDDTPIIQSSAGASRLANAEKGKDSFKKSEDAEPSQKPSVDSVNWGEMVHKTTYAKSNSKIYIAIIIAIVIIAAIIAIYLNFDSIKSVFESDDTEKIENTADAKIVDPGENQPPITSISPDEDEVTNESETPNGNAEAQNITEDNDDRSADSSENVAALPEILEVAVYAAFNRLDPVRVTSDINNKTNPYWMDKGEAGYVQFNDTLRVRGQYQNMLLLFNGHIIEAAQDNYFDEKLDAIILTRDILEDSIYQDSSKIQFPSGINPPNNINYLVRFR